MIHQNLQEAWCLLLKILTHGLPHFIAILFCDIALSWQKKSSMKYKFVKLNDFDLEKLLLLYDIRCSISKRWCRKDNSGALAVELQLYCTSPLICTDDGRLGIFCWYNVSLQRVSARSRCFYDLSLLLANMIFSMTSPLVSSSCKHLFCHPEVNISQQWAAGLYQ